MEAYEDWWVCNNYITLRYDKLYVTTTLLDFSSNSPKSKNLSYDRGMLKRSMNFKSFQKSKIKHGDYKQII